MQLLRTLQAASDEDQLEYPESNGKEHSWNWSGLVWTLIP